MIEEIAGLVLRGLARLLLLLVELFFNVVLYYIGHPIVKILSRGRYPQKKSLDPWDIGSEQFFVVCIFGCLGLLLMVVLYYNFIR